MSAPPINVRFAVYGITVTLVLSVLALVADKTLGHISQNEFVVQIIISGLLVYFPYKIYHHSNGARIAYLVIQIITVLIWLTGSYARISPVSEVALYFCMAAEVFILYWLFSSEANWWFSTKA